VKIPEEKYLPILQSLESTLTTLYRQTPTLTDYDVAEAFEVLKRLYKAEVRGRTAPSSNLKGRSQEVYEGLQVIAELYLGRTGELQDTQTGQTITLEEFTATSAEDMLNCFKHLQSSLKFWTKEGGRKGYLNYISQFV
jgi:hypothetical protein